MSPHLTIGEVLASSKSIPGQVKHAILTHVEKLPITAVGLRKIQVGCKDESFCIFSAVLRYFMVSRGVVRMVSIATTGVKRELDEL